MECPALTGDLSRARVILGAGRGLGDAKGFHALVALAERLGAQVAGTRGAVEEGWLPYNREIGLSGKQVRPELYLACGISGSNFHTVGIQGAHILVAVNPDLDARIHTLAQISILMDAQEFISALLDYLQVSGFCLGRDDPILAFMRYWMRPSFIPPPGHYLPRARSELLGM